MIIPKMYDIELTSSNYNPDISTNLTITATATDYNGNPVVGESLIIKHNGVAINTGVTTNSSGVATVTTTCGSGGTHQFSCKSASCVISVNPYPIGSIFTSIDSTSPATLFGGTWTQLEDTFLYATSGTADTGYQATGGEATHTLTISEMPSHSHTQNSHSHTPATNRSFMTSPKGTGWSELAGANPSGSGYYFVAATASSHDVYNSDTSGSTTATNQNTGNSSAHNNMPPYMKVYMWKRTA